MFSSKNADNEYAHAVIDALLSQSKGYSKLDSDKLIINDDLSFNAAACLRDRDQAENQTTSGLFDTVDDAVEAAIQGQKELVKCSLAKRDEIINAIRKKIRENVDALVTMELKETGYGRYEDKVIKHLLTIDKTPGVEDIKPEVYTGDDGLTLIEKRAYGVACCVLPSTAPSCTPIHNGICMIAAGNSVVFSPHPGGKNTTYAVLKLMNEAIKEVGGPPNIFVSVKEATIEKANEMMHHPKIDLLVATGGPGVVHAILSSGKKAIGAGPGNPPVFVDETADIPKAAKDIIAGNSFENCIQCNGEKECLVVNSVANLLIGEMQNNGAYLIKDQPTIKKLTDLVTTEKGGVNRNYIGKDAQIILKDIGISVGPEIKTIIYEVPSDHITVMEEYLMPLLPIVRVENVDEGIEKAVLIEGRRRHSAVLHSRDVHTITEYAKAIQTTILVKNGPSYSGVGFGGEGYATMTIAGPTGEGLTRPKSFTRETRCALIREFNVRSGS
jgi:propionaldehyde dehydrogenase